MESDKKLQNVAKEVLSFVAFKLSIINKLPVINVPSVSTELVKNLRTIVWVERYVAIEDSKKFIFKHFKRMTASPQLYTTYVIYACHLVTKCFTDPYEAFVLTLTLIVEMSMYSIPERLPELLGWSLVIFTSFFEKELKKNFYNRGGWKKFNKYLELKNSLEMYPTVELFEMQGKRPDEMVKLLKIEKSDLEEYLSKDVTKSEIESHGPTVFIWEMVQTTGFDAGSQFMCQLMESQAITADENPSTSRDLKNMKSASPVICNEDSKGGVRQDEQIQPVGQRGITNRIAYCQAKEYLRDLQTDCQRVEQLLDSIFDETPEDC